MKCAEFENLLPDALGDELSDGDRFQFEAHAAACAKCGREYESLRATVMDSRSLPAPSRIRVERIGERLIIAQAGARWRGPEHAWSGALLRYAASVLIAFVAGYAAHSALIRGAERHVPSGQWPVTSDERRMTSDDASRSKPLQLALADAHLRNPATGQVPRERSGLIAMLLKQYLDRVEKISLDDLAKGEEYENEI